MKAFRLPAARADDAAQALLWEHGCRGIEERDDELVAYFDEERPLPLDGRWEGVAERDYLAEYHAGLEPVRLPQLVVAPTHRTLTLEPGQKALWLDPGAAFGTGHHETTRMALAALAELDPGGRRVLDVGAGSGILAIAADLLGATEALGIDIDAATVPVARANARLNRSRARFAAADLDALLAGSTDFGAAAPGGDRWDAGGWSGADVLVANIYAEIHLALMPAYVRALRPGGHLLLTGVLDTKGGLLADALDVPLRPLAWRRDGPWLLLHARREADAERPPAGGAR